MKYFKFGFYAVVTKPLFNILIMLEIAAMLIVANMAISTANSRAILNDPYAGLISHEGFLYQCENKKVDLTYDNDLIVKDVLDSLKGDLTFTCSYSTQIVSDKSVLKGSLLTIEEVRNLYAFDEKVFSKFNLPLTEGRWASPQRNEKNQIEAVAVVGTDNYLKVGDIIKCSLPQTDENYRVSYVDIGEIVIVGTVSGSDYYPTTTLGGGSTKNVKNLYQSASSHDGQAEFLVCASADKHLTDPHLIARNAVFINYNSEPSEEIRTYNQQQISSMRATVIDLSKFKQNSDEFLYEQYIKLLPLLLCVFIIVLTGLICSVAMNTSSQLRNYGVYFLCGCRWKGCLKISLAYSAIILTGGAILGTIAFLLFQLSDYAKLFEQNLALNNIYITLAVILIMLLISLIIPFFMVRKTSPVRTIHAN